MKLKSDLWDNDPNEGTPEEWMKRYSKPGEDIEVKFAILTALKYDRKIIMYPVFESEGDSEGRVVVEPRDGAPENTEPLYMLLYNEDSFFSPHFQSIRPI